MHLYCSGCGYPILVVGRWDGREYTLSLRDGLLDKHSPPITVCPLCLRGVAPDDLAFVPTVTALPGWPPEGQEDAADLEMAAG